MMWVKSLLQKYNSKRVAGCIQNGVDIIVAIAMTISGIFCVSGVAAPVSVLHAYLAIGAYAWAFALTFSNAVALFGIIFRLLRSDREDELPNYWPEFFGWGTSSLCVFLFTVANWTSGTAAGNAALAALTVSLAGKFLHRAIAVINYSLVQR